MDEDRKNNLITAVLLLVIAIFFVFIFIEMTKENQNVEIRQSFTKRSFDDQKNISDDIEKLDLIEKKEKRDKNIYVHICGAVQNPGVYKISDGIITAEVVNLAGGLLSTADMSAVNLARRVRNGEKIEIPTIFDKDKKNNSVKNQRVSNKI